MITNPLLMAKYEAMIQAYLSGTLSTAEFEEQYLEVFKQESEEIDEPLFAILQDLFEDVDAYWAECTPNQETANQISEERLRREAATALQQLQMYKTN